MQLDLLISILSIAIGAIGATIGFQKFQSESRERLIQERKLIALLERDVTELKRDYESLCGKIDALFEKLDTRCDLLERSHLEIHLALKTLLERK